MLVHFEELDQLIIQDWISFEEELQCVLTLFFIFFSLNTPPGTKIKLSGIVDIKNGFLLLNDSNTTILGGEVEHLIEKWELQRVSVTEKKGFNFWNTTLFWLQSVF